MKTLILALLLTCTALVSAQTLEISFQNDLEIEVCGESDQLTVTVLNSGTDALQNPEYALSLPSGIIFDTGSESEITSRGLTVIDLSDSDNLRFSSNDIAVGDSIKFSIAYHADNNAIAFQDAGGVFRHELDVTGDGLNESEISPSFNILAPALTILSATPSSQTIVSGASTTRDITVINGGIGKIDQFYITDVLNDESLSLIGSNVGTISGDTIFLSGSDFSGIGNGDDFFDQNEILVIEETLSGTSCTDITISSSINVHWGCEEPVITSNFTTYANVTLDFQSPNLTMSTSENFDACFGDGTNFQQELIITNTGSGVASDVEI